MGPLLAIIFITVLPWLVQFPMCMLTAELSSALPSNAGMIQWTTTAFHKKGSRFFTFQIIFSSIVTSITDNAVYPALFVDYVTEMIPLNGWEKATVKTGVVVLAVALNIVGVDIVGVVALGLLVVVLSPFIVMVVFGAPQLDPTTWGEVPKFVQMDWAVFFPLIFWNLNGADGAGNISEEVVDAEKSFPRAMLLLTTGAMLTYLLPVLVGLSVDPNWQNWSDGYFVTICEQIGPSWIRAALPWMMFVGGMISSFGYLVTLMCTTSRLFYGIAQLHIIPYVFKPFDRLNSKLKTPDTCILLNGGVVLILTLFLDFEELVAVDCVVYAYRLIIEIACLLLMRWRYPNLPRPMKIPLGQRGLTAMCTIPLIFCTMTMIIGSTASGTTLFLSLLFFVLSALLGLLYQLISKQELLKLPEIIDIQAAIKEENTNNASETPSLTLTDSSGTLNNVVVTDNSNL